MNSIVSIEELKPVLDQVVVIDARSGKYSARRFEKGHLKSARHADLDRDLTQENIMPRQGGRHPLPGIEEFSNRLGEWGINPSSHVVIYDDKNGANAAARFWWMLRAAGHEKVQVIDGGWDAIQRSGLPVETGNRAKAKEGAYPFTEWKMPMVEMAQVEKLAKNTDYLLIDVREGYRYRGESEPIDLVAGHIPGAFNIPYIDNLKSDGTFLSQEELFKKYTEVLQGRDPSKVMVHCGSGVTACHTLLALEQAGIKGASLYVGSWSEWSRNDKPIATDV
ncbi:MAG: sulfurtransferase [Cyclobacteriaceae bacterium]